MILPYNADLACALRAANPDVLAEIVRQAEVRLQYSAQTALFRDQRNMTTGVAFGAFAAAGIGAAVTAIGLERPIWPLVVAGSVFGVFMFAAAMLALWQARPRSYYTPGNTPLMWLEDVQAGIDLQEGLADTAAVYQACIDFNESLARVQSVSLMVSWGLAGLGTLLALVAGIAVSGFH